MFGLQVFRIKNTDINRQQKFIKKAAFSVMANKWHNSSKFATFLPGIYGGFSRRGFPRHFSPAVPWTKLAGSFMSLR